jgi:hypothetical protein
MKGARSQVKIGEKRIPIRALQRHSNGSKTPIPRPRATASAGIARAASASK